MRRLPPPYASVHVDASNAEFFYAIKETTRKNVTANQIDVCTQKIESLCKTAQNPNPVFVCLSVRTAFDLYFRLQKFEPGSEVIMSAVNIPTMVAIVENHGLIPVPWDISEDDLKPNLDDLDFLINEKTVAVVLAHVFGKRCDVSSFLKVVQSRGLHFIEDCAEVFMGLDYLGHPDSDLSLFSFGVVKNVTCFGGCVAKIRDPDLHNRMTQLYKTYPIVSHKEFLHKVLKCRMLALAVNVPFVTRYAAVVFTLLGIDYKNGVVEMTRAFPNNLMGSIRRRPPFAQLALILRRLSTLKDENFKMAKVKGDYVTKKLTKFGVKTPGWNAEYVNYWLYPIIVNKNPSEFVRNLNRLGIGAVEKINQLCVIKQNFHNIFNFPVPNSNSQKFSGNSKAFPMNGQKSSTLNSDELKIRNQHLSPPLGNLPRRKLDSEMSANFLYNLIYLPVHKNVPFSYLDEICEAVRICCEKCDTKKIIVKNDIKNNALIFKAKL